MQIRRTKIIATLGPATDSPEALRALIEAGADVDLEKKLAVWERFYNNDRPHGAHKGKTPYEVLVEKLK